ncbi:MAG: hypothetical protein DHS20C18_08970 [Saprospiraceae bacterium]|nr:MAG: hypothetical protein DHS20C18_08970 [Saprospiraceae bacterium]
MKPPVIFLAFANDADDHLALLEEERKVVSGYLLPLANEQFFQLFVEASASSADLSNYVSEFKDRISIFHYGGHAGAKQLILSDGKANAKGVAELLALQKNLQLVFLNGCSTRAQVEQLLELGIPAIIATSIPIADPTARDFSATFYKALATQHNIEEAFKMAAASYFMEKGEAVGIYRGLDLEIEGDDDILPWGLYVKKEKETVLGWQLPLKSAASFIVRGAGLTYQGGESMNKGLVQTIANAIQPYSENIDDLIASAKRKGREPKLRDLRVAVIDSFPTPIGTHLRKLLLSEEINTERLQKIVNIYTISNQMLASILLAQLWDECHHRDNLKIPEDQLSLLRTFFAIKEKKEEQFNFIQLIRTISDIFEVNKIEPFIIEFTELRKQFFAESKLQMAYRFLEEMKAELSATITADEIESFCVQAEDHLSEIFKHIGFSAKYTLATVKTIELEKSRYRDPNYRHNLVILDKVTAAFGILDDVLVAPEFTDNESVILMRNEEEVDPFINLSPFIIDENALSGQQNSKLFFFSHRTEQEFHYFLTDNLRDQLKVNNQQYIQVKELFELFLREVVNESIAHVQ